MKMFNVCLSKNCLKRAWRTFLQTALGYIAVNLSVQLGGIDFNNGDILKNALIGLAISAVSAGVSAVMNLEKGEKEENGKEDIS